MITHIVLCKIRPEVPEQDIAAVWADLDAVKFVVPGMTSAHFGPNTSPEGLNRAYSHAFTMTFDTIAARDAYLDHPDHKVAGAALVSLLDGGLDGICVVDI